MFDRQCCKESGRNEVNTYDIWSLLFTSFTHLVLASVFDAKRLIGRKYDDAEVQADIKHFPLKVLNKAAKPYVRVNYHGEDKEFVRHIPYLIHLDAKFYYHF